MSERAEEQQVNYYNVGVVGGRPGNALGAIAGASGIEGLSHQTKGKLTLHYILVFPGQAATESKEYISILWVAPCEGEAPKTALRCLVIRPKHFDTSTASLIGEVESRVGRAAGVEGGSAFGAAVD